MLESSHRYWSNIEFVEEITQVLSIEVHFTHLIWSSVSVSDGDKQKPSMSFWFDKNQFQVSESFYQKYIY